jgi:S-adenosylmethionine/arginine decarboxylase-like enzyme
MAKNDYLFQLGYSMTAELPEPSDPFHKGADGLPYAAQHVLIDANDCRLALNYTLIVKTLNDLGIYDITSQPRTNRVLMIQAKDGDNQVSITVWPERRYVSFDYFAFESFDLPNMIACIKASFDSSDMRVTSMFRGDKYDRHNSTTNSC